MRGGLLARCLVVLLPLGCFASQGQGPPETGLESPAAVLERLPPCSAACLTSAVLHSTCAPTDAACICADEQIQVSSTSCIQASCSLKDALSTKNTTSTACNAPIRDKTAIYTTLSITLGVTTITIVLMRIIFKQFFSAAQALAIDDKVILGTAAVRVACTVLNVEGLSNHGLGKDVWTLPPEEITLFVRYFFVMEFFYFAEVCLIKLSLTLFYLNIFPGKVIRRLRWGTAIFNVLYGIAFCATAIFQCTPVSYYWTQYFGTSPGRCVNINSFGWVNAAISIAVDVWMIAIPLNQVRKLKLQWNKKIGVIIMFLTGTFVTVVSALRLQSLIYFGNSTNPTWYLWPVAYWSTIEVNVGMICTCLPAMRLILLRLFPQYFSTGTTHQNSSYGGYGRSQSHINTKLSEYKHNDQSSEVELTGNSC
ncbi:hypothetical protein QQS21_005712 [Conoideocrella luteorostrata]|uniref:CFEM domain-containing protein n=1 Tax=Conoideocrella luteorostrata TaxID=1105319 RepID=A0AAJ0FU70_9HYPO|nr:hypothetical protein QQS21_005712 [Conoideocrella luteorostrata]